MTRRPCRVVYDGGGDAPAVVAGDVVAVEGVGEVDVFAAGGVGAVGIDEVAGVISGRVDAVGSSSVE